MKYMPLIHHGETPDWERLSEDELRRAVRAVKEALGGYLHYEATTSTLRSISPRGSRPPAWRCDRDPPAHQAQPLQAAATRNYLLEQAFPRRANRF
jgi:hypothetical protein